jgi:hypothetical protein
MELYEHCCCPEPFLAARGEHRCCPFCRRPAPLCRGVARLWVQLWPCTLKGTGARTARARECTSHCTRPRIRAALWVCSSAIPPQRRPLLCLCAQAIGPICAHAAAGQEVSKRPLTLRRTLLLTHNRLQRRSEAQEHQRERGDRAPEARAPAAAVPRGEAQQHTHGWVSLTSFFFLFPSGAPLTS